MNERKRAQRLDYKVLHETGEKVEKRQDHTGDEAATDEVLSSTLEKLTIEDNMADLKRLVAEEATLAEDLDDFIEENPIDEIGNCIDDYDTINKRIEEMRTAYRGKHNQLKEELQEAYKEKYAASCVSRIDMLKEYIRILKKERRLLRDGEDDGKKRSLKTQETKIIFLEGEFTRSIASLEEEFNMEDDEWKAESDTGITKRKNKLSERLKEVEKLQTLMKDIMDSTSGIRSQDLVIEKLKRRYEQLIDLKGTYVTSLDEEVKKREIDELKSFNNSKLNIKLPKFKGYKSSMDIYSFQRDFEKLYLKATPRTLLPDLLKNNLLENPALLLVKDVNDIDDIWKRLKEAYGDCKMMLSKKLAEINNIEALWRHKDPEKTIEGLSKIINLMKDLMNLSKQHCIEQKLYYGDGLEKILRLMGDSRITRWIAISCDKNLQDGKDQWEELILFLEKEVKIYQQKVVISAKMDTRRAPPTDPAGNTSRDRHSSSHHMYEGSRGDDTTCNFCGATDHKATNGPGGKKIVQYFVCKKFVEMTPMQRFTELKLKGLCFQCLYPGAEKSKGKHRDGRCQRDFVCKHSSHDKYGKYGKKHVLVCEEHKEQQQNKDLLQEYKSKCILKENQVELPDYAREIQIHHTYVCNKDRSTGGAVSHVQNEEREDAIYMLQAIEVDGCNYSIFYDTGCREFVSRYDAIRRLGSRAHQENAGPITLGGVGGISTESPHGVFTVKVPLRSGGDATFTGACMDLITEKFPFYPLKGKVQQDIKAAFIQSGGDATQLPALMEKVGGDTDLMLGIKYLRYFPKKVFELPSGLTIYESQFKNADGSYGVVGGPHHIFSEIDRYHLHQPKENFLSIQHQLFKLGYHVNPDISLLGYKEDEFDVLDDSSKEDEFNVLDDSSKEDGFDVLDDSSKEDEFDVLDDLPADGKCDAVTTQYSSSTQHRLKKFYEAEEAGSVIHYRCVKCRSCKDCKDHDQNDTISIREEIEQDVINRSVTVDIENRVTTARLPLISDPVVKLCPNRDKALKVYNQQLKRLSKCSEDKESVIKSEKKLQELGFVEYVKILPEDIQASLKDSEVRNFIPWRVVWKENSMTTPCRIVFDASQPTGSGFSLNDVVAKGRNNMNKMVEIFIRWRSHKVAFHNDVQKMYNAVKLQSHDWCLQRYLWQEQLDPEKGPVEKVIKTLIYGVKSSGNQAEHGLRLTAKLFKEKYPEVDEIVRRDIYVDDCMSGGSSEDVARKRTDELEIVLNHGGFTLKGFTVSGKDPEEYLTNDGCSICVAGQKWYPKEDMISLDIKDLNFVKKHRGRKAAKIDEIPTNLSRRHCTSKVAEIFDLTGMMTPIVASMKLDLHDLVLRKLDWDDAIPNNLQQIWHTHFEMMQEMKNIRYSRAVVPVDAVDLNVDTLDFGDASKSLVCVAIYVRFERRCGSYSCQLVFSRSRLVPDGMSQPRAELYAAVVNTHAGEVVRKAFYQTHQKAIKFTDSQIVLHWISNDNRVLKQWVRNRCIEIRRFTEVSLWMYIRSENMIADIGTRRCSSLGAVDMDSPWINGYNWMRGDESSFPMMSVQEISLSNTEQMTEVQHEELKLMAEGAYYSSGDERIALDDVRARYQFSDYLIDPNRHRFQVVVRILAIVLRFIKNVRHRISVRAQIEASSESDTQMDEDYIYISEDDVNDAEKYFYKKATLEIQHFLKPNQYTNISREVNGILMYTGRILPADEVTIVGEATEVMRDLCSTTFCVPVVDKSSPVAISVVSDIHWYEKSVLHSGVETVWRYVLKKIFIIEGRCLVKKIRVSCERCRYLAKKTLDISMGPISRHNITIAPAFYVSQVDLAGPYLAYSYHNKRATIKIWLVVFCCTTTSATKIKVMEDYSTTAFIQAFTRFSCEVGYPKRILSDEGSQLIKGCESMKLDLQDLKFKLHKDVMVELEVCPVGGHNIHGKVERKIREIKKSLMRTLSNERLGIMQWETVSASIANSINNLPLALGNIKSDFDSMDLVTPNRLLMGRNNDRCPVGSLSVIQDYSKIITNNERVYNAWFQNWLLSHVPKLMEQPKWFKCDRDLKKGDVVLFTKQEKEVCSTYQFGIVDSVEIGRDGKSRKVRLKYKNHTENTFRETYRAARSLVVIHHVDEMNIMQELGEIAREVDNEKRRDSLPKKQMIN